MKYAFNICTTQVLAKIVIINARDVYFFQSGAATKGITVNYAICNFLHRVWDGNGCKAYAVLEYIAADTRNRVGNGNRRQIIAIIKSALFNSGDRVRDGKGCQGGTT